MGRKCFSFGKYAKMILKNQGLISMHTNFDKTHLNEYFATKVLNFKISKKNDFLIYCDVDFSFDEFVKHIKTVMKGGLSNLPGLSFSKLSCAVFPEDQLQHPMASEFGCEPDYNAWTGKKNPKPFSPNPFLRSAGGHIHVETTLDPKLVGRALDLFLGVPSVLMDKGEERKKLYGSAGAIRFKPYGLEYRTLSNFWIFKDKLIRWVWDGVEQALKTIPKIDIDGWETDIVKCINTNDKEIAEDLVCEFNLKVV